jgi:hypothetical protein
MKTFHKWTALVIFMTMFVIYNRLLVSQYKYVAIDVASTNRTINAAHVQFLLSKRETNTTQTSTQINTTQSIKVTTSPRTTQVNTTQKSTKHSSTTQTTKQVHATTPKLAYSRLLFCIILTTQASLKNSTKPYTVLETWASKCSNYVFVTTLPEKIKSNSDNSTSNMPHVADPLNWYQPRGFMNETYNSNKITEKVFRAFRDVYAKHGDYHFYLKADEDTFVHVDNLKAFLSRQDPQLAATYGADMNHSVALGYPSGGAGYVLSNKAMRLLGEHLTKNMSACPNTGVEDLSKKHSIIA